MEKRLIVAIVMSVLVILFFQRLLPQPAKNRQATSQSASREGLPASSLRGESPTSSLRSATEGGGEALSPATEKETLIETDNFVLTFTNLGGSLKNIGLKEYADSETGSPLALVAGQEGERAIFSMRSATLIDSLDKRIFTLTTKESNKLVYTFSLPGKFSISKEYGFPKSNDYIELRLYIRNLGNDTIYRDYDLLGASGLKASGNLMGRRFFAISSMVDGKIVRNARVKNGEGFTKGIISWTGVKGRYFCAILKPLQDSDGVLLRQFDKDKLASGVRTKRIPIYPGATASDTYVFYAGPLDVKRLAGLGFGLEQIVSYGIFGGISKILLATLRTFHRVTKNWGVAIIMLTFLINMVLFPLTRKSFLSMKKIQEVQPHIEKLRKVHKDNPQKLNKELAGVYKQYNINPLGGCLPLLLQMPIFIALYQGLIRSIELKGANFLWIKDLSSPDNVPLPFKLPFLGDQIHVLPLLMVVAMFFQQLMSTKGTSGGSPEQKQQQKIMLVFFPLFFGFLFYRFPSGLVLYWLTNTVLMLVEHSAMRKGST
jgi:YidC/Oxa1 family membrane protein insertase